MGVMLNPDGESVAGRTESARGELEPKISSVIEGAVQKRLLSEPIAHEFLAGFDGEMKSIGAHTFVKETVSKGLEMRAQIKYMNLLGMTAPPDFDELQESLTRGLGFGL